MGKIIIITNTFPPEFGAAPGRLFDMAKGLSEAGYDTTVLTGLPNYPLAKTNPTYRGKLLVKESLSGIKIRRHWMWASYSNHKIKRAFNMFSLGFSMLLSIPYLLKNKPDWIIVQYPPIALPLLSLFLSKITRSKLITNFSDLWPMAMVDLGVVKTDSIAYKSLKKIEKAVCKQSFACLAQSEEVYEYLQKNYDPKLMLYRTGAKVENFPPVNPNRTEPIKIVYMGILGMAQGVLEVCQQIDFASLGTSLHIYGDGLGRVAIEELIRANPNKGIVLHGAITAAQIPQTLSLYDASLIPQKTRIRGTVPSKIYEAMAASLPILFHGGGEGEQLVSRAGCGWTSEAGNYKQLTLDISKLVQLSSEERISIGKRGRQQALKEYDRTKIIGQLVKQLDAWEKE